MTLARRFKGREALGGQGGGKGVVAPPIGGPGAVGALAGEQVPDQRLSDQPGGVGGDAQMGASPARIGGGDRAKAQARRLGVGREPALRAEMGKQERSGRLSFRA